MFPTKQPQQTINPEGGSSLLDQYIMDAFRISESIFVVGTSPHEWKAITQANFLIIPHTYTLSIFNVLSHDIAGEVTDAYILLQISAATLS